MSLTVKVARSQNVSRGMPGIGDPGIFGALGSVIRGVAGVAKNIPGPIGWGASAVSRLAGSGSQAAPPMPAWGQGRNAWLKKFGPAQMPQMPAPGLVAFGQRLIPGGETGMQDAPPVGAPSGYHVNKTAYWRHDEAGEWQFIPAESRWVKNRRRNPLNPRAASRAIGRLESLKKATARFSRITIRKKCCK